jgi:hypothetical protein
MKTRTLLRLLAATTSGVAMLAATAANAGIFRSYLSLNGNDANPCTLQQPCRLLPAALAAANDGGEVWILDSANFNIATVTIAKSITILAAPGVLGSVIAIGADAISINAPSARVTLRNIVIVNMSGLANNGVSFVQGASLTVEGCQIYGLFTGVAASASGAVVTIKDTTIRDNETGVSATGSLRAQLVNSALLNNLTSGVSASNGPGISISDSVISGGGTGVLASAAASTTTQVAVSATALSGNVMAVRAQASTPSDTATVMINNVTFTQNGSGVSISGTNAAVFSRQNNTFKFNTNDIASGSLTSLSAQ